MTTLVFNRHGQIADRHFDFGSELPPGSIPREIVDDWLDQRWLIELATNERRSLYRLLHRFSDCPEKEHDRDLAVFELGE